MIEGRGLPTVRGVAGSATGAKLALVRVFFTVAGGTVFWCALKIRVCVAAGTCCLRVLTNQGEVGQGMMVEAGWLPGCGGMAGGTSGSHDAFMGVIFQVTTGAGGGCAAQHSNAGLFLMAARTLDLSVFSSQ